MEAEMNKFEAAMGRLEDNVIDFATRLLRFCVACVGVKVCRGMAGAWRQVEAKTGGKGLYRPSRLRLTSNIHAAHMSAVWFARANRIAAWGRL
jgi:hypothetical protein